MVVLEVLLDDHQINCTGLSPLLGQRQSFSEKGNKKVCRRNTCIHTCLVAVTDKSAIDGGLGT